MFLDPLAKANGKWNKLQNSPKFEYTDFNQNASNRTTYKPGLSRCQRTKIYTVEYQ